MVISPETIAERAKIIRRLKRKMSKEGLIQADVAEEANINKSSISGYLTGKATPCGKNLANLKEYLNNEKGKKKKPITVVPSRTNGSAPSEALSACMALARTLTADEKRALLNSLLRFN